MPTIKSNSNPDDPRPWYGVQINSGRPEIAADADGGTDFDMTGAAASSPPWSGAPTPPARSMQSDFIYGVTESGDFIAYEPGANLSEHGVSLRAHLAVYHADSDTFDIWEFVD